MSSEDIVNLTRIEPILTRAQFLNQKYIENSFAHDNELIIEATKEFIAFVNNKNSHLAFFTVIGTK